MQKPHSDEYVMMAIPAELLEEVGIDPYGPVQLHVSRGRLIMEPVDEDCCPCCRCFRRTGAWDDD